MQMAPFFFSTTLGQAKPFVFQTRIVAIMTRFHVLLMTFLGLLAVPLDQAEARVIISEFLAVNDKGLKDSDGDRSDWIEIRNAGAGTVDLAGWFLTDDIKNLAGWKLPSVKVEAGGYLLVFASGKDRAAAEEELHTNFKLGAGGEYLGLIKPDGQTVSHHFVMKYPKQRDDVSYGIPAGWEPEANTTTSVIGGATFFLQPTPGAPNSKVLQGTVAKLMFSKPHGLYDEPFELGITSETAGATLR